MHIWKKMILFSNQTLIKINKSNTLQIQNLTFREINIWVIFYIIILLLASNTITSTIRAYRHSLAYIRVNIIIILNHYLVEACNTFILITVFHCETFFFILLQEHFRQGCIFSRITLPLPMGVGMILKIGGKTEKCNTWINNELFPHFHFPSIFHKILNKFWPFAWTVSLN